MRDTYDVKEPYTGNGAVSAYTFDFKIGAKAELLIIELDDTGVETQRVRGTDTTYLSSVEFDSLKGGGTVNLAANLTTGYTLLILLANDEPTQPFQFNNKKTFNLRMVENAIDWAVGAIQRLTYRANQALRLDDQNDQTVDARIMHDGVLTTSPLLTSNAERFLRVNDAGDGFVYSYTLAELIVAVLGTGTANNQVLKWNSVSGAWEVDLYGGGKLISATQSIAAGGDITVNAAIQQVLKVQGDGAARIASITPFTGTLRDGMEIILVGQSDVNTLTIQYADIANACLLNGDCTLGNGDTLTLVYDITAERFYEISRSK